MKKRIVLILTLLILIILGLSFARFYMNSLSSEEPTKNLTINVSNDILKNAETFMKFFKAGNIDGIYAMTSNNFKSSVKIDVISKQSKDLKKQLGDVKSFENLRLVLDSGYKTVLVYTTFEKGTYDVKISFDMDGKYIEGYSLQESTVDGANIDTEKYKGEEISFTSGDYEIYGTLILPKNIDEPLPVVILLQDSGTNDRDETIYGLNKPLKDIAEGLANMGIASLRYDKRTYTYGHSFNKEEIINMSIDKEFTEDLSSAIDYLSSRNEFDKSNIYVLGHGISGYILPYIYDKELNVKGGISLAGTIASSFEDFLKSQYNYLANYDGKVSEDEQAVLDEFNKGYELVKKMKSGETIKNDLILGIGQDYWNFFNNYNGIEQWKLINKPTLVLQGERDYELSIDNFNFYKKALESNETFTFKTYKKLSHIFMKGNKKPSPDDYKTQKTVDKKVIEDIGNWINNKNS